jgi:hypothetical protein
MFKLFCLEALQAGRLMVTGMKATVRSITAESALQGCVLHAPAPFREVRRVAFIKCLCMLTL